MFGSLVGESGCTMPKGHGSIEGYFQSGKVVNAENLLVIQDKNLAGRYTENWQTHAQHSEVYSGKGR